MGGRREIEMAKLRLAAAKRQASLAEQMAASAKKEVGDAEACLKDAEQRWEVIDVDADDCQGKDGEAKKRRKVSLSPAGTSGGASAAVAPAPSTANRGSTASTASNAINIGIPQMTATASNQTAGGMVQAPNHRQALALEFSAAVNVHRDCTVQLLQECATNGEVTIPVRKMTDARLKSIPLLRDISLRMSQSGGPSMTNVDVLQWIAEAETNALYLAGESREVSFCVTGCGILEANGPYRQRIGPQGHNFATRDGVPVYSKQGTWTGEASSFHFFRQVTNGTKNWVMAVSGRNGVGLFLSAHPSTGMLPPFSGWVATGHFAAAPCLSLPPAKAASTISRLFEYMRPNQS